VLEKMIRNYLLEEDEISLIFGISRDEVIRKERIENGWKEKGVQTKFPLIENKVFPYTGRDYL